MSLLNVVLQRQEAYVAVDTRFLSLSGSGFFEGTKMLILPHANVVFASRGERTFLHWVFNWFLMTLETFDFDGIERVLPQVLQAQFEIYAEKCKADAIESKHYAEIELVVVGWSQSEQHMICLTVLRKLGDDQFSVNRMKTGHIAPAFTEDLSSITVASQAGYMSAVARAQTRQAKRDSPGQPVGGRLLMATVTKDKVTVETIARLG
jgi:hypothetical protein